MEAAPIILSGPAVRTPVIAYADESGNTGNNVFDPDQPYFRTLTILSPTDLDDAQGRAALREWLTLVGRAELHGTDLRLRGIERIAHSVRWFLANRQARFVITTIDKRHAASLKMFDTFFDPGLNPAVSNLSFLPRALRLILAVNFLSVLPDESVSRTFWDIYDRGDTTAFAGLMARIEGWIVAAPLDSRSKTLLGDAVAFARLRPAVVLCGSRTDLDAPNLIALGLMIAGVRDALDRSGYRVSRFVHDEQNQFAAAMKQMFDVSTRIRPPDGIIDLYPMTEDVASFACPLEMRSSQSSLGLQLADVLLWLVKKAEEAPLARGSEAWSLAKFVTNNATFEWFTPEHLQLEVLALHEHLMRQPLSVEAEARAKKLIAEVEVTRANWREHL